jgi:TonB family protein
MRTILITTLFFTHPVIAENFLNGIADYEQLGKEFYLGALYLPETQQNSESILTDSRAQKAIIKITAKRWSPRKFEQVWRQDIALNNDLSEDLALTKQLIDFIRFPKENLVTGDTIEFRYSSSEGSRVILNGETILQDDSKKLFNALLRAWIGEVPNSQRFQKQILGLETLIKQDNEALKSRFENLKTEPTRLQLVTSWKSFEKEAELALAKAEEELRKETERLAAERKREEDARKKAEAEKKKQEEERKKALALAEKRKKEAEAARANNGNDSAKVEQALAAQKAAEARAARIARAQQQAAAESQQAEQQRINRQYALDKYRWEVLRDVYNRVSYPEWARQFDQEGIVSIEFIVNASGQLLGISSLTPIDSGLLGQELKDAVNRAAPFNAFPAQVKEKQMKIVVDYAFSLTERVAELPPAPKAPKGAELDENLTSVQKAVKWSNYKTQAIADISASIEYPYWAKDLRQMGTVAARITILADGSVKSVKLTKQTRHSILNKEIELAVDRIGGFATFPSWIEEESITIEIEHTFEL